MKKKFKFVLFTLILALICPVVFFACGETLFDDVPYTSSSANLEEVVSNFNAAGEYMVNNLKLKSKFETTNTYTFYNTQTSTAKTVKDVIITTLGSANDNPTLAIIDTTRFVNDIKITNTINTYVQPTSIETETPYCYSYTKSFVGEEETYDKNRDEYNPNINSIISFYNFTIYEIKKEEVNSIQQKEFEGVTYYKLNSGLTANGEITLDAVNDRFVEETENNTLQDNPQLFKISTKAYHDAAENFYYECAKNSSNYATYFKIHYNLKNKERETYLNVSSVTRLTQYGDKVSLDMPEDVNEYIANSFMKTMTNSGSYISYTTTEQINEDEIATEPTTKVTWTVAKIGKDYSVRRDEYQAGAPTNTTLFYLVYISDNNYNTFLINGQKKKRVETNLELLNFNFDQTIFSKNEEENTYQYGNEQNMLTITFNGNNIYSLSTYTERNDSISIYIEDYGKDFTKLPLSFVTDIDNYEREA